jgi:hypothetical protein
MNMRSRLGTIPQLLSLDVNGQFFDRVAQPTPGIMGFPRGVQSGL